MYIQNKKGLDPRGYIGQGASYRLTPGMAGFDVQPAFAGFDVRPALAGNLGCPGCLGAVKIPFTESLGAVEPAFKWTDLIVPALIGGAVLLIFRATLRQGKRDYRKAKRVVRRATRKTKRVVRRAGRAGRAFRRAWARR